MVKDVKTSGYDPEEEKIYSFTIDAVLENGRLVLIRDEKPYDFREYIGKEVDLLIRISYMNKINAITKDINDTTKNPIIKGKYLGKYNIPEKWKKNEDFSDISGYHAINYDGMIFLISPRDFIRHSVTIKIGEEFTFQTAGMEIEAWLPLVD